MARTNFLILFGSFTLFYVYQLIFVVQGKLEFTNIKCEVIDKKFCVFQHCFLKSVNRTYKYFSVHVHFLQPPVHSGSVNFVLYKRSNGLRPFLFNYTMDVCKFLDNRTNPASQYFYSLVKDYTNVNHTCPYDHDVVNWWNKKLTISMPVPTGRYLLKTLWISKGILRAEVFNYFTLTD
ncbi:uncharacterized protein LOC115622235 [Scaptodrosophila lebanonensis]|uniref:Uncharacterized protein LOC115622235 n=1 Tax=Drosophila lebanonensis TaxID=7225 RepID=A0A6J2TAK7_DROLE|nr:uncharacterized protein LOC115622235 [Scaptodrosophila lebanonensis]